MISSEALNIGVRVALCALLLTAPLVTQAEGLRREAVAQRIADGEAFNYNTGEANLVGGVLRAAIGNNASTYLTHKIWHTFGMEADATCLLDAPGGVETGGRCISATLRDYARIGLFALHDGLLPNGERILPEGWMAASTQPSKGNETYGYQWWLNDNESFNASGIFGQKIYVNPGKNLVIAAQSNAPTATGSDYARHLEAVLYALDAHL